MGRQQESFGFIVSVVQGVVVNLLQGRLDLHSNISVQIDFMD
jgi:hypothetical protein